MRGKKAGMLVVRRMLVGVRQHSNQLRWKGSRGKMGQCWSVGLLVGVHVRPCAHVCQKKEKKNQKDKKRPTFTSFLLKAFQRSGSECWSPRQHSTNIGQHANVHGDT
jgi:hypothetical protein